MGIAAVEIQVELRASGQPRPVFFVRTYLLWTVETVPADVATDPSFGAGTPGGLDPSCLAPVTFYDRWSQPIPMTFGGLKAQLR